MNSKAFLESEIGKHGSNSLLQMVITLGGCGGKWSSGGQGGAFSELVFLPCYIGSFVCFLTGTHNSPAIFLFLDIFITLFSYSTVNLGIHSF